jgi:hypothetical protein
MSNRSWPVQPLWHTVEPQKWGWAFAKAEALKAAVARVKKLVRSINATHPPPGEEAWKGSAVRRLKGYATTSPCFILLYHRLPVVRFQVAVIQYRGFMGESLESHG